MIDDVHNAGHENGPARGLTGVVPDTAVYPMPSFLTLFVADLPASTRWYVEALGMTVLAELAGPDGPVLVHLRRLRYQDILLLPAGPARGRAGGGSGASVRYGLAAGGEDLRARAERARAVGAGLVEGPSRTAWNTVDLQCVDPDGHHVVLTAPVDRESADEAFSSSVRAAVRA